jgi:hypothetical protein
MIGGNGRCDIIWYPDDETVYYIELKGVFNYGRGNEATTIRETFSYIDEAIEQVKTIVSLDTRLPY